MVDKECCVCFKDTDNLILPCQHRICKLCILRWCEKKVECPMCKKTVISPCAMENVERRSVCFPTDVKLGVTLTNSKQGDGVFISRLSNDSVARSLRMHKGQLITHINDIPIAEHDVAVRIINSARETGFPIHFCIEGSLAAPTTCWHRFALKIKDCLK